MSQEKKYRLITLVGVVSFPQMPVACDIRRNASKASIFDAFENGDNVVFVTENPDMAKSNRTEPTLETVNKIGCLCHIMNVTEVGSTLKVQADGIERVEIKNIIVGGKYPYCTIGKVETTEIFGTTLNLLMSTAKQHFVEYASFEKHITPEIMRIVDNLQEPNNFVDAVTVLTIKDEKKQLNILNETNTQKRLELLIGYLMEEVEIAKVNAELAKKVHESMDKNQKEYYLREQMKAISEELGDDDANEFDEIENKIKNGKMPEEVQKKALKELARVKKLPNASPDYSVLRNYLDVML